MFVETRELPHLGLVTVYSDNEFVLGVTFHKAGENRPSTRTQEFFEQVNEYLDGSRQNFTVPYKMVVKSLTEKNLYNALRQLPYGEKLSYEEFAQQAQLSKGGARVAGSYCANNAFPLIVPCHRIVQKNGTIGDYQAGSKVKSYLLNLEQQNRVSR